MNVRFCYIIVALLAFLSFNIGAQELYVGTNYHPHDSRSAQWNIDLMKNAGFKVVRMGHLACDSYEPSDGKYQFTWFDIVMYWKQKARMW